MSKDVLAQMPAVHPRPASRPVENGQSLQAACCVDGTSSADVDQNGDDGIKQHQTSYLHCVPKKVTPK